ncbi:MAG TPA: hypothetical protein DEW10_05055 [Bifidobacterium sp.]|nr:hypothetical protein [Bifidobacterium sp.]
MRLVLGWERNEAENRKPFAQWDASSSVPFAPTMMSDGVGVRSGKARPHAFASVVIAVHRMMPETPS